METETVLGYACMGHDHELPVYMLEGAELGLVNVIVFEI